MTLGARVECRGALAALCFLPWTARSARAQAGGQSSRPAPSAVCGSSADASPGGLVVVLPNVPQRVLEKDLQAVNNPYVSGVAIQVDWRDLEPAEGKPDWSRLDALLAAAASSHKWVQLLIIPGFFSPSWALEGVRTDEFRIPYGPGHGTTASLPMPWDPVYLGRWFAFVRRLAERYAHAPALRVIAAAGPTSVSDEMTLPVSPRAFGQWMRDSYTPAKYLDAWEQAFSVYAQAFPNQCVSLSAPNLPILQKGRRRDPQERLRVKREIVERARRVFGRRLVIQWCDLHAGRAAVEAPDNREFINGYSGSVITGFQMRGGSRGPVPSRIMGAEGDPPLALRRSVDKGMIRNGSGRHVDFLEIYEGDVLAAEMQPVLQYAASLFHPAGPGENRP